VGNLTFAQTGNNKTVDYKHNNLNQMTQKIVDNHDVYNYTFDHRGNLTQGIRTQNANQSYLDEQYVYDSTNRMVKGTNDIGETSDYVYNGLGCQCGQDSGWQYPQFSGKERWHSLGLGQWYLWMHGNRNGAYRGNHSFNAGAGHGNKRSCRCGGRSELQFGVKV